MNIFLKKEMTPKHSLKIYFIYPSIWGLEIQRQHIAGKFSSYFTILGSELGRLAQDLSWFSPFPKTSPIPKGGDLKVQTTPLHTFSSSLRQMPDLG